MLPPPILSRLSVPVAPLCPLALRAAAGRVRLAVLDRYERLERLKQHIVRRHGPLDLSDRLTHERQEL